MKIKVLNTKANLLAISTIFIGFIISFTALFYMLSHPMSEEYINLTSENFKYSQSKLIDKKIDTMLKIRTIFKNNYTIKNRLLTLEESLIDSILPLGLIHVNQEKSTVIGNNSLKFSYDYLSQKKISNKWFFENLDTNYYIVNIIKEKENYFIVYENVLNLVKNDFKERVTLDSLYLTNSENRSLLISNKKVFETGLTKSKKSGVRTGLFNIKVYGWLKTLNNEIMISYSMNYKLIDNNIFYIILIFSFFVILSIIIYLSGINRSVGLTLKSLIIKMSDFSLNKESNVILPLHRKDIIGDVIREFEKLVRNISEKNIEINDTNKELERKSSYLSNKMNEIQKLKDIIIKSLNTTDVNSMVKELTEMLKDVFNAYGVVLVRNIDDSAKIFHTFTEGMVTKQNLSNFISTEIGLILTSETPNIQAKYKEGKRIYSTITLQVKVQTKILGYLIVFNKYDFKDRELDVITTFNSQVGVILENLRLYGEEKTKNELENEFMDAQEIQDILINKGEGARKSIGVETYYLPAVNIGGDWFDAVQVANDKYLYMIADITGHGAASALITTMFSTYFKVFQEIFGTKVFDHNRVSNLISGLNDVFINLTGGVKNATFAIALYDKSDMSIDYLSAGHNASYLYDSRKGKVKSLQVKNIRLGDEKKVKYSSRKYSVSEGDVLFMYTDGLIENNMSNGQEYGKKRLLNFLKKDLVKNDTKNFRSILAKDIDKNVDMKNLNDDVTFLVAKL